MGVDSKCKKRKNGVYRDAGGCYLQKRPKIHPSLTTN